MPTPSFPRLCQADIILKYDGDEARSLKTYGELPDTVQINAGTEMLEGEEFGDDSACSCCRPHTQTRGQHPLLPLDSTRPLPCLAQTSISTRTRTTLTMRMTWCASHTCASHACASHTTPWPDAVVAGSALFVSPFLAGLLCAG